jgi:MFS family permease
MLVTGPSAPASSADPADAVGESSARDVDEGPGVTSLQRAHGSSRLILEGEVGCGPLGRHCGPENLLSWPLPVPTPSLSDHGILPALWAVFSYYVDEGTGLVMTGSFLLGPTWSGAPALIPTAFPSLDYVSQRWIYAVYVATYAIVQFFVSPPTGQQSDRVGRKPVMMVCMWGFAAATLIQAVTLQLTQGTSSAAAAQAALGVLFFARALRGLFGGITGVVKAVMSDAKKAHDVDVVASEGRLQSRSHASFFVYFGFTVGFGRLCGVTLGTYGARDLGYAMPMWFLVCVDVVGAVYIASPLFRETNQSIGTSNKARMSPLYPLRFLAYDAWRMTGFEVGAALLVMFFFRIAWMRMSCLSRAPALRAIASDLTDRSPTRLARSLSIAQCLPTLCSFTCPECSATATRRYW